MKKATEQTYRERILRVLVHIQQNLDEAVSLQRLAEVAHFSPFHFHRIFRAMVGETVVEHVRRLRLERAAVRLKHTDLPVTRLAFEAGYETHESFTRAFGAMFGVAPSRFRTERRSVELAAVPSGVHYATADERLRLLDPPPAGIEARVEDLDPVRAAFMRHVGPYRDCGETWDKFVPWMGSEGLLGGGTILFALCHDDPDVTPDERIRYDVCASVGDDFAPRDDVGVQVVAGGPHVVTTHHGPYDRLGAVYLQLFGRWLPRSGWEPRGLPCREVYLNDPESTEPEELLTDICLPVQRVVTDG